MEITVSEAGTGDERAIAEFFLQAWHEAGPDMPGFSGATDEVIAEITQPEAIRSRIGGPQRRMFLAWDAGAVVGFAATRHCDDDTIELAGIVVLQSMTGRGIGTPLVDAAAEAASRHGYATMTVETEVDNERALSFYQARGFSVVGDTVVEVEGTRVPVRRLARPL